MGPCKARRTAVPRVPFVAHAVLDEHVPFRGSHAVRALFTRVGSCDVLVRAPRTRLAPARPVARLTQGALRAVLHRRARLWRGHRRCARLTQPDTRPVLVGPRGTRRAIDPVRPCSVARVARALLQGRGPRRSARAVRAGRAGRRVGRGTVGPWSAALAAVFGEERPSAAPRVRLRRGGGSGRRGRRSAARSLHRRTGSGQGLKGRRAGRDRSLKGRAGIRRRRSGGGRRRFSAGGRRRRSVGGRRRLRRCAWSGRFRSGGACGRLWSRGCGGGFMRCGGGGCGRVWGGGGDSGGLQSSRSTCGRLGGGGCGGFFRSGGGGCGRRWGGGGGGGRQRRCACRRIERRRGVHCLGGPRDVPPFPVVGVCIERSAGGVDFTVVGSVGCARVANAPGGRAASCKAQGK
mmetsp:Transcript_8803/g.20593  ORF Transcript_8803/g.20593 Transcript_8803/m.20593 type:complete len:404 (-) Transcript_8803:141-1352(-)